MVNVIQRSGVYFGWRMGPQQDEDGGSWKYYEISGYKMRKDINKKHGALRVSRTWCSSMRMTILAC